jgi:hypothetical protein
MHAPAKSTARTAGKFAGRALNPRREFLDCGDTLPLSPGETCLAKTKRGRVRALHSHPRSGGGNFPGGLGNCLKVPANCRKVSVNFPKGSDNCPGVSANFPDGRGNFLKGCANFPDASGNFRKGPGNFLMVPASCPRVCGNFLKDSANFPNHSAN